jgi:hypothetical protein
VGGTYALFLLELMLWLPKLPPNPLSNLLSFGVDAPSALRAYPWANDRQRIFSPLRVAAQFDRGECHAG